LKLHHGREYREPAGATKRVPRNGSQRDLRRFGLALGRPPTPARRALFCGEESDPRRPNTLPHDRGD
jgi:hypothetical protein